MAGLHALVLAGRRGPTDPLAGERGAAVQRALRPLDDLDAFDVRQQALVGEQARAGGDEILGRDVDAIHEERDVGAATRIRKAANRDAHVLRSERVVELDAGRQLDDIGHL